MADNGIDGVVDAAFRASSIPSIILDSGACVVEVNPAYEAMSGRTRAELLGLFTIDLIHANDLAATLEGVDRLWSGAPEFRQRRRHRRGDGTWQEVLAVTTKFDVGGSGHLYVQLLEDHPVMSVDESDEQSVRAEFPPFGDAACFHDADGRMVFVTKNLADRLGRTVGWLSGRRLSDPEFLPVHTDGSPYAHDEDPALSAIAAGVDETHTVGLTTADGSVVWYSVLSGPAKRDGIAVRSTLRDVSELIETQRRLLEKTEAEERARSAENTRKRFLATMSHELRTPMAGVILAADALGAHDLTAEQQQLAAAIRASADSLIEILDEVLDLADIDSGRRPIQIDDFEITALITDVVLLLAQRAAGTDTVLIADVAPTTRLRWRGDRGRLRQVLLNLVSNAIRYTPAGSVRVSATASAAGDLQLEVVDNGFGIEPVALANVFDPHVHGGDLDLSEAVGFGLALSTARDLALAMNATMTASSHAGHGSRFVVEVPGSAVDSISVGESIRRPDLRGRSVVTVGADLWARESVAVWLDYWTDGSTSTEPPLELDLGVPIGGVMAFHRPQALASLLSYSLRPAAATPLSVDSILDTKPRGSCLVVDDEPVFLDVMCAVLETLGYHTVGVSSGSAALDLLGSIAIDFVFLDLSMPGMSGIECLAAIRHMDGAVASTPVCVVSGTALTREELIAAGANEFLQKPTRSVDLAEMARRLTESRQTQ